MSRSAAARSLVLLSLVCAPFLVAGILGCPAAAVQFQPVLADSTVIDTDPTPSPDGKWLAYTSEHDSSRQIWIRPIGGGPARQLTREPDPGHASTPTWAPDSKSLLFISTRTKDYNIYSVPFEGGEGRPMSDYPASNRFAVYSPDAKQIAFPSNRAKPGQMWGFDLFVMDGQGEKTPDRPARRLTNNIGSPGHPTWSPDGKWIGYVAKPIDSTATIEVQPGMTMQKGAMFTAYHLWKVRPEGGTEIQLTGKAPETEPTEEIWPSWSPDGKWIASQRRVGGKDDVWLFEVESGRYYRLTSFGNAGKPTWAPDGKSLWFVRVNGRDQDIWVASHLSTASIKAASQPAGPR